MKTISLRLPKIKLFRTPAQRSLFIHLMVLTAIFTGLALLLQSSKVVPQWAFPLTAIMSACLGVLHLYLYGKYTGSHWTGITAALPLLTLAANLSGVVMLYLLSGKNADLASHAQSIGLATFTFSLPFFIQQALNEFRSIPEPVYRDTHLEDLRVYSGQVEFMESNTGLIFEFAVTEDETDDLPQQPIRIFVPEKIREQVSLKIIFGAVLLHYNMVLNPQQQIHVRYHDGSALRPYRWYFQHRKHRLSSLCYLDDDLSLNENRLRFRGWRGIDANGKDRNIQVATILVIRNK